MATIVRNLIMKRVQNTPLHPVVDTGVFLGQMGLRLAKWVVPLGVFGVWFIFPAIPDSVRKDYGLPVQTPEIPNVSARYKFEELDKPPVKK